MTLKEIIQLAQTNIGEDTDDDSVTEAKLERSIVTHINRAYMDIIANDWRPFKSVTVTLDADSAFELSAIPDLREIKLVKSGDTECQLENGNSSDTVVVIGATPLSSVDVVYYNTVDKLELDDDEPEFPEQYHDALADYAAYRMLCTGSLTRQQRGAVFYNEYMTKRTEIRAAAHSRRANRHHFINRYAGVY